jgi:hypothetical protein
MHTIKATNKTELVLRLSTKVFLSSTNQGRGNVTQMAMALKKIFTDWSIRESRE